MKNSKKTYVLLIVGLCVCVVGMIFLGYNLFFTKNTLKMVDFVNAPKSEVLKWVTKNNLENNIKYV